MFEERRRRVIDDVTPVDWKNAEWLWRFIKKSIVVLHEMPPVMGRRWIDVTR